MAVNHGYNNENNNTLSTSLRSIVRIKSPRTDGNQLEDSRSFIVVARNPNWAGDCRQMGTNPCNNRGNTLQKLPREGYSDIQQNHGII